MPEAMLRELNIKNFAIIDQLQVEFGPGLNVLTGETGAGKSIIVDALNLVLGERASTDLIRTGCQEAVVEAAFELNSRGEGPVRALLAEQGIEARPGEDLLVRRVISSTGKNKVYINGSQATLAALSAVGAHLADIHGQHEHQSLLSLEHQLAMLDSFGSLDELRNTVAADYRRLQDLRAELSSLEAGEREKAQREDLLRYQAHEVETSRLLPGEDEALAQEQKLLVNSEKLAGLARAADDELYTSDRAALTGLKRAVAGLREIVSIDPRLSGALELCEAGRVQIEEAAREVSSYAEDVEFDPRRLEEIGDRIDLLQRLKKKYGGTIDEVIAFGAAAAAELERMERSGEEIARLRKELAGAMTALTAKALELSKQRQAAARDLEKKVEQELGHLGMKKSVFSVHITQEQEAGDDTEKSLKLGPRGVDHAEFLISPNPGEEPKALARIASGGELSRVMLALKTILAEGDRIPTLVFDEVDAGIGGAVAEEVGRKLQKIAERYQVFCITHLAQIASMAARHYGVVKSVAKDRTSTEVRALEGGEQVDEVARMLGGKTITPATMKHAEEMIERGRAAWAR